jgi:PatG Domain
VEQIKQLTQESMDINDSPIMATSSGSFTHSSLVPQSEGETCATCSGRGSMTAPPSYVYALGKIEWRFPKLSVEKEFAQVMGRTDTTGQADREATHTVLIQRQNRYLVRQLCWVLNIEGLATYILTPRDPADLDLLVEAVRP